MEDPYYRAIGLAVVYGAIIGLGLVAGFVFSSIPAAVVGTVLATEGVNYLVKEKL